MNWAAFRHYSCHHCSVVIVYVFVDVSNAKIVVIIIFIIIIMFLISIIIVIIPVVIVIVIIGAESITEIVTIVSNCLPWFFKLHLSYPLFVWVKNKKAFGGALK